MNNDESKKEINDLIEKFDNYAKSQGFKLNPNRKIVEGVIAGLLRNKKIKGEMYCPCRIVTGDKTEDAKKICACAWHKDEVAKDGHCHCNLYVK